MSRSIATRSAFNTLRSKQCKDVISEMVNYLLFALELCLWAMRDLCDGVKSAIYLWRLNTILGASKLDTGRRFFYGADPLSI